jgi:hypothetical protein
MARRCEYCRAKGTTWPVTVNGMLQMLCGSCKRVVKGASR